MTGVDINAIHGSLDDLAACFGARFIIGLSGGGDSVALLHICADWAHRTGAHITALCFDHGFRDGSAGEAQQAAKWARSLGIAATIVTNQTPKPHHGLQAHARALRLGAFARAAHDAGGATILLGHTLDDQAETIAFRIARQTGLDGLAGIAPVVENLARFEGQSFPIARPLLSTSRASLRAYLTAHDQTWIEDPSNLDTTFTRVKTRQRLALLGQSEQLVQIGALAQALRNHLDDHIDGIEPYWIRFGPYVLDADFLGMQPDIADRLLQRRLRASGANNPYIDSQKRARLLERMRDPTFRAATLSGIKVARKGDQFTFTLAPSRRDGKRA